MNVLKSANGRLCCKSRKLQGSEFFAKTRNGKQSTIRIISIALPKSPVSFARGDEVPHIFTRIYAKAAPAARRIFDHQCKTTFATQSANSGLMHCSNLLRYSITSSASASNLGGTSRLSAFAVAKLKLGCNVGLFGQIALARRLRHP